jgi:hypothetical protein
LGLNGGPNSVAGLPLADSWTDSVRAGTSNPSWSLITEGYRAGLL